MPEAEKTTRDGIWIDEHIERSTPRIAGDDVRVLGEKDAREEPADPTSRDDDGPPPPAGQR